MQDLGQISRELSNEPENLRHSILSGMAKLKGLDLLTGVNAFQIDKQRLDAKQRAIYRLQGLDLKETEDDETITNILADNITIDKSTDAPIPSSPAQPAPGPTSKSNRWLPWLLAGGLAAGNVGAGAWLLKNLPTSPPNNSRTTVGLETE